ncbi:hypothetical protein AJ87_30525 [Rhizobium yanglingense]|nr:hypothetical protein AJ87_30525 [Rhizobium yanglingense]
MRQRLQELKLDRFKRLLDLGCGTGLTGGTLRDLCEEMTGIDISENMVEIAHKKEIYETLFVAEVEDFLDDNDEDALTSSPRPTCCPISAPWSRSSSASPKT